MISEATINEEVFALNEEGLREALMERNLEITGSKSDLQYRLAHARYIEEGIDSPPPTNVASGGGNIADPPTNPDDNVHTDKGARPKIVKEKKDNKI